MALLYYQNIVERDPNVVMRNAVFGLKIFYDFLKRTKKFVESDYSVMPLGWKPGYCPFDENGERQAEGCWIELIEPLGRLNDSDAVFCDYFDEKVKEIYEQTPEEYREFITNKPPFREVKDWKKQIKIIDRDPQTQQLCLERQPDESSLLTLRPNTRTINCQLNALRMLQDKPQRHHLPLLQLFERPDPKKWEEFIPASIKEKDWLVLTDAKRDGTDEQRRFVKIALNTPDFALLEGPPGSGKTTAICELILQLAKLGKRVLLCGSTHIAVDNVLERLMDRDNLHRDTVIPVRIGDRRSVSEKALPWQIDEFMKTERERILRNLNQVKNPTESQSEFKYLLEQENNVIERMVLETANLVCGTPIGILQHPDIKKQNKNKHSSIPKFDFLIFDEASKTPFQEFLVPALWAKRWIIVGDPKQLSPYVDENAMEINIEACLPNEDVRNACVDTFLVRKPNQPHTAAVATTSNETKLAYLEQCDKHNIKIADADQENCTNLWAASIVIGEEKSLSKWADKLPLDITTVRCPDNALFTIKRRSDAWQRLAGQSEAEQPKWASEVGWRTVRLYELRLTEKPKTQGGNRDNKKNLHPRDLAVNEKTCFRFRIKKNV